MRTDNLTVFDPLTLAGSADPYPLYAALRQSDPVHESTLGVWMMWRYQDVFQLLRSGLSVEYPHPVEELPAGNSGARLKGKLSMLRQDPPDHTRLRRLVSKAFTRHTVDGLEPRIRALVDESLDRIARLRRVDLVKEFALPLPLLVISDMLGMPTADLDRARELTLIVSRVLDLQTDQRALSAIRTARAPWTLRL